MLASFAALPAPKMSRLEDLAEVLSVKTDVYMVVGVQWIYESLSYCAGSRRSTSSLTSETRPLLHKPKAVTALPFAAPNVVSHIPNVNVSHQIQVSTAALQGCRWPKRK